MSDLIQRQDAIEAVYEALRTPFPCYGNNLLQDSMTLAKAMVNNIPSAETKRKGKWETVPYKKIEHGEIIIVGDVQRCSVCRHAEKEWNKEMKYCPNCGARMEDE